MAPVRRSSTSPSMPTRESASHVSASVSIPGLPARSRITPAAVEALPPVRGVLMTSPSLLMLPKYSRPMRETAFRSAALVSDRQPSRNISHCPSSPHVRESAGRAGGNEIRDLILGWANGDRAAGRENHGEGISNRAGAARRLARGIDVIIRGARRPHRLDSRIRPARVPRAPCGLTGRHNRGAYELAEFRRVSHLQCARLMRSFLDRMNTAPRPVVRRAGAHRCTARSPHLTHRSAHPDRRRSAARHG